MKERSERWERGNTKEEKLADIAEAKKCFEEAHALMEKGKKLIKKNMRGVEIVGVDTRGDKTYEVHTI